METNINTLKDQGLLAELAYLKLENDWFEGKTDGKQRSIYNMEDVKNFIDSKYSDIDEDKKPIMKDLLDRYEIISFSATKFNSGDFQAMFVKEKSTNQITYAIRGTELTSLCDLLADAQLAKTGNATLQQNMAQEFYNDVVQNNNFIKYKANIYRNSLVNSKYQRMVA